MLLKKLVFSLCFGASLLAATTNQAWSTEINAANVTADDTQLNVANLKRQPFSIGETISYQSTILDEQRTLNIYLPHSYKVSPNKSYPVIYVLDGSADEDFIHIAGLVQFGSFSWINMLEESIVVGIANVDRKRDFTYPSNNKLDNKDLPTNGGSAAFIKSINEEIQPLVNNTYRTTKTSTLIGQSLGGLLATEILFKQPDLFTNYIIVSPSLWWDDESLLRATFKPLSDSQQVYIAVGKEGDVMERVARALSQKVKKVHPKTHFKYFPELSHGDTLHLAVYKAFEWLFRAPQKDTKNAQ